jgi:hypothetical protein
LLLIGGVMRQPQTSPVHIPPSPDAPGPHPGQPILETAEEQAQLATLGICVLPAAAPVTPYTTAQYQAAQHAKAHGRVP